MSLSPAASTAEVSTCSESQAPTTEAAGDGDNNGLRSVRIPTTAKNTSSLDHDSIEGLMVVHRKKKQRQRFLLSKSAHYVVANSTKHALEIYNNDRTELVYLLSLADAVLSFESDNANIVMEKCFCVEVRTWKKKNTVRLQPQGFIFFEENQTRMLPSDDGVGSEELSLNFEILQKAKRAPRSLTSRFLAVPNWIRHPDVDRVEWLNKVFTTGWPYLKTAIENSVCGSLNPVLDAQKPAFMNSLSLVRLDLGSKAPQISSVKFVSANTLTDEVTLDVEVRVVMDKKSFVADLKMVSHLGAAVCLSLRELLLVGTLRITLNPLAKYWPCFRGLSLSFTTRPFFDFSLTAAKINIANVPFVSEWLHTFLYDLLIDYFVWPNVVDIPLWDEHGHPVQ
ncbi:Synaptotagmin-1 [Phytophthora ramorum]|uniref:Synaptotagmin-1 n=1 Tax=Phytophthora ramorum TaxID=164328 RepID=UPI0030A4D904|nr:Synaptotagmin-1 [Phytophthora ramorum]